MKLKKIASQNKFLCQFLTLASFVGMSASLCANAQTETTTESNGLTQTSQSFEKENPNPTTDVAGGVGENGFKPPEYAVLPTGKTLPKGIFRARFITARTFGDFGFDESGDKSNTGLDYDRWMGGLQLEYGLTKSFSIGIGVPYVYSNHVAMNGDAFQSTEAFQKYYNRSVSDLAKVLVATGQCGPSSSTTSCITAINAGLIKAPAQTPLPLPTGEYATVPAQAAFNSAIRDLVIHAATPADGETGLGDIQFGFLWSAISEDSPIRHVPLYVSVGGGLRIPTGKFDIASALRSTGGDATLATGGGTYDAIFRGNLDYVAFPGVILSWQHQMEVSLTSANLGRTSMIDPSQKSTANASAVLDPTKPYAHGDGVDNTLKFTRKGIHEIGFVQAAWGVGNVAQNMKWLGVYSQAKYNIAAQAYLNDKPIYNMGDQYFLGDADMHPDHGYEQYYSAVIGTKFSGLPYMIPVELATEFEYPFAGKNRINSPMNAQATLNIYF
jgi:hypothetical protein